MDLHHLFAISVVVPSGCRLVELKLNNWMGRFGTTYLSAEVVLLYLPKSITPSVFTGRETFRPVNCILAIFRFWPEIIATRYSKPVNVVCVIGRFSGTGYSHGRFGIWATVPK